MTHDYPGNIRELENIIEYTIVICKNSLIGPEHLPDYLQEKATVINSKPLTNKQDSGYSLDDMERGLIYETLKQNEWNRTQTAAQLNIHPSTLWRKMKRLRIEAPKHH
jgi:transcriptional regulator with PAS, ATPase and Fis domain